MSAVGSALDGLFTSDDERLTHDEILERLRQRPHLAQAQTNQIEAKHRSLFVAGWRPFVGWVCGIGLSWHFLGYDIARWATAYLAPQYTVPTLDGTSDLLALVLSMLGLGGLRTWEKFRGVTR